MLTLLLLLAQVSDPNALVIDRVMGTASSKGYREALWLLKNELRQDPYQFGLDMAQTAGRPRSAATWFQGLLDEVGENDDYRFGLAWSLWLNSDVLGAYKTGARLINSKDPVIRARSLSLMGQIHGRLDKHDAAMNYFRQAVDLYRAQKKYGGVFTNSLYLAKELIERDQYEEARKYIGAAEQANLLLQEELHLPPKSYGQLFFLNFYIAYRQGVFREAAYWAERSIKIYEEERNFSNAALSRVYLGLCQALNGDLEQAEKTADQVEKDLKQPGVAPHITAYSNLTWLVINRCRGLDIAIFEKPIEDWIKDHNDPMLQGVLDNVRQEPCNSSR